MTFSVGCALLPVYSHGCTSVEAGAKAIVLENPIELGIGADDSRGVIVVRQSASVPIFVASPRSHIACHGESSEKGRPEAFLDDIRADGRLSRH